MLKWTLWSTVGLALKVILARFLGLLFMNLGQYHRINDEEHK